MVLSRHPAVSEADSTFAGGVSRRCGDRLPPPRFMPSRLLNDSLACLPRSIARPGRKVGLRIDEVQDCWPSPPFSDHFSPDPVLPSRCDSGSPSGTPSGCLAGGIVLLPWLVPDPRPFCRRSCRLFSYSSLAAVRKIRLTSVTLALLSFHPVAVPNRSKPSSPLAMNRPAS